MFYAVKCWVLFVMSFCNSVHVLSSFSVHWRGVWYIQKGTGRNTNYNTHTVYNNQHPNTVSSSSLLRYALLLAKHNSNTCCHHGNCMGKIQRRNQWWGAPKHVDIVKKIYGTLDITKDSRGAVRIRRLRLEWESDPETWITNYSLYFSDFIVGP